MKSKKAQKTNTNSDIKLIEQESSAVSGALDFMMHLNNFSYEKAKITFESAYRASEKLDNGDSKFSRGEIRAMSAAIELALHCLREAPDAVSQVSQVFPDLIPDLRESEPMLELLRTRFRAYVAKCTQRK